MISYASNGEDVVLDRAFALGHLGFYIDVGASDPVIDSVTMHFYERGWSGINVEPASGPLEALVRDRPRDTNLGVGVAEQPGEPTFYELPRDMIGCSTFSHEIAREYLHSGWRATERTVNVTTLAAICERHVADRTIDFLKVDVEGDEQKVLAGADFERFRPRVLVVDATVPGTAISSYQAWEPMVLGAGYQFVLFDGLNRFFVRDEDHELASLLAAPANALDDYVPRQARLWHDQAQDAAAARRAAQESDEALRLTREELVRSRRALNDARTELATTRTALMDKLHASSASEVDPRVSPATPISPPANGHSVG